MRAAFKRNLLIGFGLSLLLLIISSVASFVSIQKLIESARWVEHTNKVITELESTISTLKDAETGQRGYLLANDKAFLSPYIGAKDKALNTIQRIRDLTIDNDVQTKSADDLANIVSKRMTILEEVIAKKDRGEVLTSTDLERGKQTMDLARSVVRTMEDRENTLLIQRNANLSRFAVYTPVLIVIAALLSIIITLFFYMRVKNDFEQREKLQRELEAKDADISRRIGIIQNIAEKISAGNYAVRTTDEGSDGLGALSYSLNSMAASLEYSFNTLASQEWLQKGVAQLNDAMIGEKTMEGLSGDIINIIAGYTKASVGALYVKDNAETLRLYSGYAFDHSGKRDIIKVGEGLTGQAVASGREISLTHIPADAVAITYATGEIKPTEIIALPVFDGIVVKGAIELGSTKGFSEWDIKYLKTVSHNIGIAINSTQNRKRLQELLEETQSQAEELQAQHSELEGLNTELEMQTQKLQASEEELRVQQEELMQANQELEERTRMVEDKNELIVQRNFEIQAKAEELELSTRYKSEFLANMSHELRTPLNSILLLSRLLSENGEHNLSNDQVEYAQVIQSSGRGLLSLIDEILDLSKIESGKMELEYTDVTVNLIADEMKVLFGPVAQEKKIDLQIHMNISPDTIIQTDKLRVEQIVRNLLSNALKFTSQGYVSLSFDNASNQQGVIAIAVKDTGIGIPQEKQRLIFEAFQQADGSTRRKYGGTGLGLSISRQLAKLLHGDIALSSVPGEGSEFILYLPTAPQYAAQAPADQPISSNATLFVPGEPAMSIEKKDDNKYTTDIIPDSVPDDRDTITNTDPVILIIEDDTHFAKSLLDFARSKKYKAIIAVRGDEGVELAMKFKPRGILLDIQLPVKNGWQVMSELKQNPLTRHIPVHIMSSFEVKKESLLNGAVDFINKPVAFEKLQDIFQKIEQVLTRDPKKVLIVEENTKHAKALAYFLENFNVTTEVKDNVEDGITALQDKQVDCVILDMGIPTQRSYETLDEVKKQEGLENLPIIVFTGKSLSHAEEMRIKQYADSIVVKTAHSYQRILDEVSIFLHLVEENIKPKETKEIFKRLGALNEVLRNKTVLVVDDDVRNIFSLTKTLELYNMNVLTAIDGKDALRQLIDHPNTDIVLMDMMMPEMDGYETIGRIRKDPQLKQLPVIAVTAKAMTGDREKCINAGASDYITKPVDTDQLLSLLRVWLYERNV
ncbi:MAG: response regulator [Filimonas sp.]|nr:response regulator [Filimonas sp.]